MSVITQAVTPETLQVHDRVAATETMTHEDLFVLFGYRGTVQQIDRERWVAHIIWDHRPDAIYVTHYSMIRDSYWPIEKIVHRSWLDQVTYPFVLVYRKLSAWCFR